jgi:hypothetical protein
VERHTNPSSFGERGRCETVSSFTNTTVQKPYVLQPKFMRDSKTVLPITYVADFYIEYDGGSCEVVDTKGFADSVAKIKRKMFWFVYPDIQYRWVVWSKVDGGWCDFDFVQKMRSQRRSLKMAERK